MKNRKSKKKNVVKVKSSWPWVVDDSVQRLFQLLSSQTVEVEDDGSAEATHTGEVIMLIAKERHTDQRHPVKHGFIQTVSAAMSHECSCFVVSWGGAERLLWKSIASHSENDGNKNFH